jgi:hypothetical protein
MRISATITAYDYMDKVGVTATLHTMPNRRSVPPERLYHKTVTLQGVGEADPVEWLKDALIGLLETL